MRVEGSSAVTESFYDDGRSTGRPAARHPDEIGFIHETSGLRGSARTWKKAVADTKMMLKKILMFLAMAVFTVGTRASAQMLTVFDFNSTTSQSALFASSGGLQTSTITTSFTAAGVSNSGGTALGETSGDTAGQAASFISGAGTTSEGTGGNNGGTFQFTINTVGYRGLSLIYATQKTATGFAAQTIDFSVDGTTFTNVGALTTIPTSFALETFPLPTAAEGQASLTIRFTLTGATSTSGNDRIDNLQVTVPEPSTYATMVLGGAGALAMLRDRRRNA